MVRDNISYLSLDSSQCKSIDCCLLYIMMGYSVSPCRNIMESIEINQIIKYNVGDNNVSLYIRL